eukprot:TRINITY_DN95369_c0_g1_i1.p1 TRINITY_DN95369_c0_g1~~TRINITY_DN95369_c0_g1_i1.p1  ORF type:complete len:369 (+),score=75.36 TRINITY_DN95369_c0_g1_i1:114-1220(+)
MQMRRCLESLLEANMGCIRLRDACRLISCCPAESICSVGLVRKMRADEALPRKCGILGIESKSMQALGPLVADRVQEALALPAESTLLSGATPMPPTRDMPHTSPGLKSWSDGDPEAFRLRCGPSYARNRAKSRPGPAMYQCTAVEVVEASEQLRSCTGALSWDSIPQKASYTGLPEVIVVNFQLPFDAGSLFGEHPKHDHGCSVLFFFKLKARKPPADSAAAARLLRRFLWEEGHPKVEGSLVSRCFKVVGLLENMEELGIPLAALPVVRRFNGKPVLIEKETRRYGDLERGVVELAVDVRGFNPLARSLLKHLRGRLPVARMQLGLLVQGVSDEELPEGFLGVARVDGLDLIGGRRVEASVQALQQ